MYQTNGKARAYLKLQGFESIYFFPHLRFMKDYHLAEEDFDAMGFKDKKIWFFQIKTNCKPTKKILERYKIKSKEYNCGFGWLNCEKGVITEYGTRR